MTKEQRLAAAIRSNESNYIAQALIYFETDEPGNGDRLRAILRGATSPIIWDAICARRDRLSSLGLWE